MIGCDGATGASHIGYCPSGGGGGGGGEFTLWDSGDYTYDGAGNITGIGVNQYYYDEFNRLTDALVLGHNATSYTMGYQYDAFGNMEERKKTPSTGTTETTNLIPDWTTNRLTGVQIDAGSIEPVTYDPNGNMLANGDQGYAWDERNRLTEVSDASAGVIANYDYDANGYRIRVETEDTETFYVRDRGGQILSEFKRPAGSTDPPVWDRDYIYALGKAMHLIKNEVPAVPKKPWVTIDQQDPTNVTVHWEAVQEPDVTHHTVQKSWSIPGGGFNTAQLDIPLPATTYQDTVTSEIVKYQIRSRDAANNYSAYSPELVVRPTGSGPPQPAGLTITPSDQSLRLTWSPITTAEDDDIWGYYVEREIPPLGSQSWEALNPVGSPVSAAEYIDAGLVNGSTYRYRVKAVDTASRISAPSSEVDGVPVDNVGPAFPLNVIAQAGRQTGQVEVFWDPVTDPDLGSYEIWRSVVQGQNGTKIGTVSASVSANVDQYTDTGATEGATYYYSVVAVDQAGNESLFSAQSQARPRHSLVSVPQLTSVAFEVDDGGTPAPTYDPWQPCDITPDEENDDRIRVRVQWDETASASQYRVYRATGTGARYEQVGSTAHTGSGTAEFFDYDPPGFDFTYYVVATEVIGATEEESAASTLAGGSTDRAIDDFVPSEAAVRAIVVKDGRERYSTLNAHSRSTQVRWSRVLESQLQGYHVYRYCQYDLCSIALQNSPATFKCEPTWVRLTAAPVSDSVREFIDDTVGGMLGCFRYAVRPVSLDGTEGHVDYDAVADLIFNTPTSQEYPTCARAGNGDWRYEEFGVRDTDDVGDMNPIVRGTADPAGAPQTPVGLVSEMRVKDEQTINIYATYFKLNWVANQESDLAGYHVEMAGSADGPWERLTDDLVAWWETEYLAQIGAHRPTIGNSRDVEPCSHFRLVAVDESGNESPPTAAATHDPFRDCGEGPTLEAPTSLVASTEPGTNPCNTRLNWDPIAGADEYIIYRFGMLNSNYAFYQTEVVTAPTTTFLETGDGTFYDPLTCPYASYHSLGSCGPTLFSAFYVTARKTSYGTCSGATTQACDVDADCPGGETCVDNPCPDCGQSPKSNVVFWDCTQTPGFARWMPLGEEAEYRFAIASAEQPQWTPSGDTRVSLREGGDRFGVSQLEDAVLVAAAPAEASDRGESLEIAVAPFATLGSTDPPWQLLDLHHDHLGSTRLVTGDNGALSSQHDFLPFGEEIAPVQGLATKKFTGHERTSEVGVDYMMARFYASQIMGFLSPDPGNANTNLLAAQTWNRYTYANSNPIRYFDLAGEFSQPAHELIGWLAHGDRDIAEGSKRRDWLTGWFRHWGLFKRPRDHFPKAGRYRKLVDKAIAAKAAGDEEKSKYFLERAIHTGEDDIGHRIGGPDGRRVGPVEHAFRNIGDYLRRAVGLRCKWSPDCRHSKGYEKRFEAAIERTGSIISEVEAAPGPDDDQQDEEQSDKEWQDPYDWVPSCPPNICSDLGPGAGR